MSLLLSEIEDLGKAKICELQALFNKYEKQDEVFFALVEGTLGGGRFTSRSSSWLLRRWVEAGNALHDEALELLAAEIDTIEFWETRLHLCQIFANGMLWQSLGADCVARFSRKCIKHDNKFLRAWGLSSLVEICRSETKFHKEALSEVRKASALESSKAVLARLRILREKL